MEYEEALKYISSGEAVLFAGSFFSSKAYNILGERIPTPACLKTILLTALNKNVTDFQSDNLDAVAGFAQKHLNPAKYQKLLKDVFTVKSSDESSKIISSQNWQSVFTTNYDNLIELNSHPLKHSVSPYSKIDRFSSFDNEVYHVNGFIDDLKGEYDDIYKLKLSSVDYLENKFQTSFVYTSFLNELSSAKAIFYVGYSGRSDFDISVAIHDKSLKDKSFFICGKDIHSEIERERLQNFGKDTNRSIDDFSKDLKKIKKNRQTVTNKQNHKFIALQEVKKATFDETHIDSDLLRLINQGEINNKLLQNSNYVINRWSNVASLVSEVSSIKFFTVSSTLGNGKSVFMRGLAQYVASQRPVFFYRGNPDFLYSDLQYIQQSYSDSLVFIDTMSNLRNSFANIVAFAQKNIQFVISDRTPILSQITSTICSDYGISENDISPLKDVDSLSNHDYSLWQQNLNRYHMLSPEKRKKAKYFRSDNPTFSMILLEVFKSSGIVNKYRSLFKDNSADPTYRRLAILILMTNTIGTNGNSEFDLVFLQRCLRVNITNTMTNSKLYGEFIDFKRNSIINHSSVLAKALLQGSESVTTYAERTDILISVIKNLDSFPNNKQVDSFIKALTSFSNISLIFSQHKHQKETAPYIERFYTEIQNLNSLRNNVFFILQLANSKIYSGEYDLSEVYLNNAEEMADQMNLKHRYQLVNTRVNLYVESASETIAKDPKMFIEHLKWINSQKFDIRDFIYLATMFGKLRITRSIQHQNPELIESIYGQLLELYTRIRITFKEHENFNRRLPYSSLGKFSSMISSLKTT